MALLTLGDSRMKRMCYARAPRHPEKCHGVSGRAVGRFCCTTPAKRD